jgi:signal transduction histidine kinase/DNA-binding response OmpR family regulator
MHFASPKQNKYKYMLVGFNDDWITTDYNKRFASYSNLNSGNYVFKVKASNNDTVWNDIPREIQVKILPALWKTWWAYLLYILFAIFLMWLFRRYILESEEYKNRIKIEKLEHNKIKEVNKMKLEFFTNVSHEFKTPLTLILGPLQNLLKMETNDSKTKESLLIMDRNANHLYRLINQVMDFRRVESNQLRVQASKGDFVDFCEKAVSSFHVLANEKHLSLSFKSEMPELMVYFDQDIMEKILNNLISNAIKYTPDSGKVKVAISVVKKTNQYNDTPEIKIIVEDSGIGIPKNKTSKIFGRFYQVSGSNKANSFGSGVGLALTKKLIDLLQGDIKVLSEENKGSSFIVTIPLIKKPLITQEAIDASNDEISVKLGSKPIEKEIIDEEPIDESIHKLPLLLIVEDNSDMQSFLKSSLEDTYKILQAFDGEQGLKMALKNVPNIIISDVMMPKMDGIEFCTEIKQNDVTNHVPVILLTAKGSVEHKIEGIEVGADAYIPKPFDMRFLKIKTQKLLEEREFLKEKFASKGITLDSQKIGINNTEKAFLEKAESVIEDNLMNSEFGVEDLADSLSFSRMQLYRKLKTVRGLSANEFIRAYRIKKAALLLRETDLNVSEILYDIGFTNRSYFSKCFKQNFEMSPKEYAKKYRTERRLERDNKKE